MHTMTAKFILLAGLFTIITAEFSPAQNTPTTATVERDPVSSFKKLVTTFPKRSIQKSTNTPYDIVFRAGQEPPACGRGQETHTNSF
jgi:hypothetical protein